jgi:hypothetical protein
VILAYNDSVRRCDGGSSNICATQVAAPLFARVLDMPGGPESVAEPQVPGARWTLRASPSPAGLSFGERQRTIGRKVRG